MSFKFKTTYHFKFQNFFQCYALYRRRRLRLSVDFPSLLSVNCLAYWEMYLICSTLFFLGFGFALILRFVFCILVIFRQFFNTGPKVASQIESTTGNFLQGYVYSFYFWNAGIIVRMVSQRKRQSLSERKNACQLRGKLALNGRLTLSAETSGRQEIQENKRSSLSSRKITSLIRK